MIDMYVSVQCSYDDDSGDSCEAEFELSRIGVPADLRALVDRELRLRGWSGDAAAQGSHYCPLHPVEPTT